jgi:N-acetylglucosaminyl-diphospho-decaprenol L-rhamnosyltransferase
MTEAYLTSNGIRGADDVASATAPRESVNMDALIVTHNSGHDLTEALDCVPLRQAFSRIVVVDNNSDDDSVAVAHAAGAEVVARTRNDSLAAAVNAGARRMRGEIFALLNPDVQLDHASSVASLARHFAEPGVGAVAPALRLPNGALQDSAREVPTPGQLALRRLTRVELGVVRSDQPVDVDWVVAAFMLVRRSAFEHVGGFDENYRLYFEDVDFCVRLWSAGWAVRLDPTVVARHEHRGMSRRTVMGRPFRQHVRSAGRFFARHPDLLLATGRDRLARPARSI